MSRAANTVSSCYQHLEWREDALCVYFAHMKNDQRGVRPRDPRHVYANPIVPAICPILTLDPTDAHVFPGNDEYDRFRKILGRDQTLLQISNAVAQMQMTLGLIPCGKERRQFYSSGSTACPSAVAVHLRAGWSKGGVQDRYLRHDAAGDMFVGRT
ncbi:hypothetical protein PHMEG_00030295, partial [Phytophthora megakarya]